MSKSTRSPQSVRQAMLKQLVDELSSSSRAEIWPVIQYEKRTIGDFFSRPSGNERNLRIVTRSNRQRLKIRINGRIDLSSDAVILNHQLGSIGIFRILDHRLLTIEETNVETVVTRSLSQAGYLRQCLMDAYDAYRDAHPPIYSVDLVFAVQQDPRNQALRGQLSKALRNAMDSSSRFQLVNVNLYTPLSKTTGENKVNQEKTFRRGFSWLLYDVIRWNQRIENKRAHAGYTVLTQLYLKHFRLHGERNWAFAKSQKLHLVHGYNGSGKSTLCEALELLLTGKLDRIEKSASTNDTESNYIRILKSRSVTKPSVKAGLKLNNKKMAYITEEGLSESAILSRAKANRADSALASGFPASAFRLDQTLSDTLAKASPERRAGIILEAFFPKENDHTKKRRRAEAELKVMWEQAPKDVKRLLVSDPTTENADSEELPKLDKLLALQVGKSELSQAEMARLYGLSEEEIKYILEVPHPIGEVGDRYRKLHEGLRRLNKTHDSLTVAMKLFKSMSKALIHYRPGSKKSVSDRVWDSLPAFLNAYAHHDLIKRQLAIARAQYQVMMAGITRNKNHFPLLIDDADNLTTEINRLEIVHDHLGKHLKTTEQHFHHARASQKDAQRKSVKSEVMADLTAEEVRAINLLASTLGVTLSEGFNAGDLMKTIMKNEQLPKDFTLYLDSKTVAFEGIQWREKVAGRVPKLRKLLAKLPKISMEYDNFQTSIRKLKSLADELDKLKKKTLDLLKEQVNGPLANALNELMALMTPSRWAYKDINAAITEGDNVKMDFESDDEISIDLQLNTAELNLFTLSFFLLCAVRRTDNPIQTIVLDDPLQNMDEVTVSAVGRALASVLRSWDQQGTASLKDWQVIILLHSEGDLERLRSENHCAVYYLPWLASHSADNDHSTIPSSHNDSDRILPGILELIMD